MVSNIGSENAKVKRTSFRGYSLTQLKGCDILNVEVSPMNIIPFSEQHIIPWQEAIDRTPDSPGPTSGPEYGSSMDVSWKNTYIFQAGDLFLPFSLRKSNQLKIIPTANYAGAQINSLLGVRVIDSSVFDRLAALPRDCVITLQLPRKIYDAEVKNFALLNYDILNVFDYHMIPLRDSYDEWFNRKVIERRFIRKAERENVEVRFGTGELLPTFYDVYRHSVQRWQKQDPRAAFHRLDRMQRLFTYPNGRVQIALGYFQDKPIAGVIFAQYQQTAAYLFGGFNYEYQHLRAMFLVHATIVKRLIDARVRLYSHGLSLGRKSLEHFKESLGAERNHAVVIVRHRFPQIKRILGSFRGSMVSAETRTESGGNEI